MEAWYRGLSQEQITNRIKEIEQEIERTNHMIVALEFSRMLLTTLVEIELE